MASEYSIKRVIRMVATNWRRTDLNFFQQSYPSFFQAFENIEDDILEAAITKFLVESTASFQPPLGVIRKFVMKEIGIKEAKERKAVIHCKYCYDGFRDIGYLYRKGGRYHMNCVKGACDCPAGTQKITLMKGLQLRRAENVYNEIKGNINCVEAWVGNPDLPFVALCAGNPLMEKQRREDAAREGRLKKNRPTVEEMTEMARAAYAEEKEKRGW